MRLTSLATSLIDGLGTAGRAAADRWNRAVGRTVLHTAVARKPAGFTYRAWFSDAARCERLVAPITSFAWSLEVDAIFVASGIDDPEPHFELSPLTPGQAAVFRERFSPTRERLLSERSPERTR